MFVAAETIPAAELEHRHNICRAHLIRHCPKATGLVVTSRVSIYYLTGTLANGLFWLPLDGKPLLLVRKGRERVLLETPLRPIVPFKSYSELIPLIAGYSTGFNGTIAVDKQALPWHLAEMLMQRIPDCEFISGDLAIAETRAVKTTWELDKMRLAGQRHDQACCKLLPRYIRPGMTEREISHILWQIYFSLGHAGLIRMSNFGEEVFLGHISVGTSGNYPSHYNGPLGLMGEHPAVPFMGNASRVWQENKLLAIDTGFSLEGYVTDKTQIYFSGPPLAIPQEVQEAHHTCLEIEQQIARQLLPGAVPAELYSTALRMADQHGWKDSFMGLADNKVPFLGHSVGLTVDEWPVIAKNFTQPLEEGMTIALEPKIGLPGLGMVGSENTYEVTARGGVSLTGPVREIICIATDLE